MSKMLESIQMTPQKRLESVRKLREENAALQRKLELARDSYKTALRGYCEKSDGSCPVSALQRENEVLREALESSMKAMERRVSLSYAEWDTVIGKARAALQETRWYK